MHHVNLIALLRLAWLVGLCGLPWDVANAERGVPQAPATGLYLVPLLPYGPSNQAVALKEALGLAVVLNRRLNRTVSVVSYGILEHFAETKPQQPAPQNGGQSHDAAKQGIMPLDLLFDTGALAASPAGVRVVSAAWAQQQLGWSGSMDLLLAMRQDYEDTLRAVERSTSVRRPASASGVKSIAFKCDDAGLRLVERHTRGVTWLGLYGYRRIVPPARTSYSRVASAQDACSAAYLEVCASMPRSAAVRDAARGFAATRLGSRPYVALHVRPYPDSCLEYWLKFEVFQVDKAIKVCKAPRLYDKLVPLVRQVVDEHGLGAVFIMAHPGIRSKIRARFELERQAALATSSAGKKAAASTGNGTASVPMPVFFDMDDLQGLLRLPVSGSSKGGAGGKASGGRGPGAAAGVGLSVSLLSMVEQEVCRAAAVFLGTPTSSMSVSVAQERLVGGGPAARTQLVL